MSRYPILVADYRGDKALTIICEACDTEDVIGPDDIYNDGIYECPKACGGWAVYKYEQADACKGCGKLGFFAKELNYCCSRKCRLQAEYAESLKGSAA